MKDSIHKYFQIGTLRWMSLPKTNVLESVRKIAIDDYFDVIEISGCKDEEERKAVKNLLAQSHMKICYGAQPRLLGEMCIRDRPYTDLLAEDHKAAGSIWRYSCIWLLYIYGMAWNDKTESSIDISGNNSSPGNPYVLYLSDDGTGTCICCT